MKDYMLMASLLLSFVAGMALIGAGVYLKSHPIVEHCVCEH